MNAPQLALTPTQLHTVQLVLHTCAPGNRALAFGSRVCPRAACNPLKPHADLDIALTGARLPAHTMFALRDAFSESDLPFRVDVVMQGDLPAFWVEAMVCYPIDLNP